MPFHSHKLPNGLQIIAESSPSARSAAVGFFVRTGSRDETPEVSGVSHFLEHMAFKGSAKRTAFDVNREFDAIGADYNAFTSEENTVYHAAVLPEFLPRVIDITADLLRPTLRQEDFDMEKKVIINEIGRYEDQPMWSAYDNGKQVHFGTHNLGNSILGTPDSITALTRDQMEGYFRRRYIAPNITVVAAGKFDWEPLVRMIEEQCGDWGTGPTGREGVVETPGTCTMKLMHKPKVAQEYFILMGGGPPAKSKLRHAADLLGMVIGDDSGSRLYWTLVDPGLVDSADCSFHEYEGTGVYYTSFSCEPDDAEENLALVHGVLHTVQTEGITSEELETARSKLLSRIVRSNERPRGRLVTLGMQWTYHGEYRSVDDDLKAYEAVTLDDIREVIRRYPLDKHTTLALGPLEKLDAP